MDKWNTILKGMKCIQSSGWCCCSVKICWVLLFYIANHDMDSGLGLEAGHVWGGYSIQKTIRNQAWWQEQHWNLTKKGHVWELGVLNTKLRLLQKISCFFEVETASCMHKVTTNKTIKCSCTFACVIFQWQNHSPSIWPPCHWYLYNIVLSYWGTCSLNHGLFQKRDIRDHFMSDHIPCQNLIFSIGMYRAPFSTEPSGHMPFVKNPWKHVQPCCVLDHLWEFQLILSRTNPFLLAFLSLVGWCRCLNLTKLNFPQCLSSRISPCTIHLWLLCETATTRTIHLID